MEALATQTQALHSLAQGQRNLLADDVEVDDSGTITRLPGAKGATALENLRRRFEMNPT
ncbi:MAG: hypothetical protein GY772_15730, partial [bacterium]|nr:hypothetical protein [bacterium]